MNNKENISNDTILFDKLSHIRSNLSDLNTMVSVLREEYENISDISDRVKSQIKDDRDKATNSYEIDELRFRIYRFSEDISEIKNSYEKLYSSYQKTLEEGQSEFGGVYPHIKNGFDFNNLLDEIEELSTRVEWNINYLEEKSDEFSNFVRLLNDFEEKPEIDIDDLREERTKLASAIDEADNLIKRLESSEDLIENRAETLQNMEEDLDSLLEEVNGLKETASNLVKGQAGASIGREFEMRKEELRRSLRIWGLSSVLSISILISSAFYMYLNIINGSIEALQRCPL